MYPVPTNFDATKADQVYKNDYEKIKADALQYKHTNNITPSASDKEKVALMIIDNQNTFCIPGYELFVGGASGTGAVDDTARLCEFIYTNLGKITKIIPTMDTHTLFQIFHSLFFIGVDGSNPAPMTTITTKDIKDGVWQINPAIVNDIGNKNYIFLKKHILHYVEQLEAQGKYSLTIWPFHAMLGGIGHALVSLLEEAILFHAIARGSQPDIKIKGGNPLTENYSVLKPEVLTTASGDVIAQKNIGFLETLLNFDKLIIAGQAKSHCLAWTIKDLLNEINTVNPELAKKVYILEDCTSPVVVPGIVDYTDAANVEFEAFKNAGMNIVTSTTFNL